MTTDDEPVVPPPPERNWVGLQATAAQAMEWGIQLCGQLAEIHVEQEIVVGRISAETIERSRFDQPSLPEPDPNATNAVWEDLAALATAIRDLVADPPPEFLDALLPPYATAIALGQELQDAQAAMGLPVAPIPYEHAPLGALGGFPIEVPPESDLDADDEERRLTAPLDAAALLARHTQADLDKKPNTWVLLGIAFVVLAVAVAIGVGWR